MAEKYIIGDLEDVCGSIADSIKKMSIKEMTEGMWTLQEEIAAIVRGHPGCSEMKPKKVKPETK